MSKKGTTTNAKASPPDRSDLIEVRTTSPLRGIRRLLDEWVVVVQDFHKSNEGCCWWYNERASLSTLAGAAWRLEGWTALEEFSTEKRGVVPEDPVEKSRRVQGRCDLYVAHGSKGFAIEAKQAWQHIGERARTDRTREAAARAWEDTGRLTADEGDYRIAATFIVPYLALAEVSASGAGKKNEVDDDKVRIAVKRWLEDLELSDYDGHAFVFPRKCADFVSSKKGVFPGVLLLMRKRSKGRDKRSKSHAQSRQQ